MQELILRATQDGGMGLGSAVMVAGAFIGLLRGHGRRRERRQTQERLLDMQRQLVRAEQRAARAEGTVRVLRATLVLGTALILAICFGAR